MKRNLYDVSAYDTYIGGDFKLQIMKNTINTNGKKILLIRDSFANVVAPFLALQVSELHICDMRDFDLSGGEKINVKDYLKTIKPDYVIVLYSGIDSIDGLSGKYDYFS